MPCKDNPVLSCDLVLGDGRPELGGAVVGVCGDEVGVGRAQRLQELGHDGGGVLGQGQVVLDKCTLITFTRLLQSLLLTLKVLGLSPCTRSPTSWYFL